MATLAATFRPDRRFGTDRRQDAVAIAFADRRHDERRAMALQALLWRRRWTRT